MGKARKRGAGMRRPARRQEQEEEEEEEQGPPPSPSDPSYFQDQVEAFHEARSQAALAPLWSDGESGAEDADEEEEVLGLDEHEEEEGEEDEEDEEEEEEEDAGSVGGSSVLSDADDADADPSLSWGQRKNLYYNTDYRASKGKSQQEADEEEREEEEEAQLIQRRLTQALQEDDFGLSWVQAFGKSAQPVPEEAQTRVVKDLDKVPTKEKLKMLRKESPELLELIEDLKAKLTEVKDELEPLLHMVEKGLIPPGKGSRYLKTKYSLYLNYCSNISFYLVLKARRVPIHGHPVIERLVTYRNFINKLAVVDQRLSPEIRCLLSQVDGDGKVAAKLRKPPTRPKPKSLPEALDVSAVMGPAEDSDLDEEAALKHYKEMEERLKLKRKKEEAAKGEEEEEEDELPDSNAKRAITYQIAKNKGLTPRRKKIDRNPRVKHREKFRRAKIRRRGQVPQVRTEEYKYSGELSGIRAGVKKSIKLK
ncbi:something about silencing protein 10 [Sarcophilus harrisii]|uniref:something about silencing protein 10 n=1 Tax=Sarcophilus harrisii TaxID=9305 RepID=UPI000273BEFC|nr:something about silencing protein 10 [Sarcophilus harrisii]